MTAEADTLSTDAKQLLEDSTVFLGCHSSRNNDLSVHARIDSTVLFASCGNQVMKKTEGFTCMRSLKWKVKRTEGISTDSCERTADTLFDELESVSLAIEGSDLNIPEDNVVPPARCIQDTTERATGDQIRSSRTNDVVYANSKHWRHLTVFDSFSASAPLQGRCHCWRYANAAAYKYHRKQEYQDLHISSVAVMLRDANVRSKYGTIAHLKADFILILIPRIILITLAHAIGSWLLLHGYSLMEKEKPPGPRIMRNLESNSRERTQGYEKGQGEDSSYPEGIEVLLGETARKGCSDPDYVDNPMIAPQDFDARQSGQVLELQNKDLFWKSCSNSVAVFYSATKLSVPEVFCTLYALQRYSGDHLSYFFLLGSPPILR